MLGLHRSFTKKAATPPIFNLRFRLLALSAFILFPAFSLLLYTTFEQRRAATEQAQNQAHNLLQLAALDQKHMVGNARQQLITLAQLPIVRDPSLATQCVELFIRLKAQHRFYNNLGVANPEGQIYCSGATLTRPVNIADRDYFRAAIAKRDFSISDYQIGRVVNRAVIAFGYPILDDKHILHGVAFVSIDLATWFKELAADTALPNNASLLLISNKGTIFARHPDPEHWMGKTMSDRPLLRAIKTGQPQGRVEDIGIDGVRRLYVYTQLHEAATGQVYLAAGIPTDHLYAYANTLFWNGLVGILLIATIIGLIAWVGGSRLILAPVLALTRAAKQLGQGDLQARTQLPHGSDELGQLAQSFDQMAASLQEKNELLATVGAMAKVGGWEFDVKTQTGSWTSEVAKIHDMDPEAPPTVEIGLTVYQGESRKKIEEAIQNAVAYHKSYDLELAMLTPAGNHKWVRTIGQPVVEHDQVVKVRGSFQDITEHKRAAEEIQRLNADLERKVIERTSELESVNRELEAFSYSVSHDLRAPLRTIDGFSQAILEDCADRLDDQGRGHLYRIRAATQHMGYLIDDLLKLAKVTRAELHHENVNLSELANSVIEDLKSSMPERNADWIVQPDLVVCGDKRLLRVVLENLLGNAWKFTARQTHARIEFGQRLQEGGHVYFVCDNGVGFDMTYAGKLFGAFQRLHSMSEFPGTGVGLATVQRILHRHGGLIWAESAPGNGACFYFSL